jgi:hypothetical protein
MNLVPAERESKGSPLGQAVAVAARPKSDFKGAGGSGGSRRSGPLFCILWRAFGQWPKGVVRTRNGVDDDLRFENLIVTRHGRDPFGVVSSKHSKGGKASSLDHRAKTTTTLLQTLAEHPGATVPMLSRLVGSSASCTCTRLGKLSDAGLCIGPKCDARARWDLSQKGRELAARTIVVLDDLDHDILRIIARSQTKLMKIVAQTGVCRLTARRRVNLMVERKLIESDGRRFNITDEGRKALGDAAPQPWARPEPVAASLSRDVRTRLQHPNDDRSSWARAEQSSRARQKGIDKARENGQQPFIDPLSEFDRLRA